MLFALLFSLLIFGSVFSDCVVFYGNSNLTQSTSPATWNALPDHIRTVADPVKFRKLLISHYFSQAFNIC